MKNEEVKYLLNSHHELILALKKMNNGLEEMNLLMREFGKRMRNMSDNKDELDLTNYPALDEFLNKKKRYFILDENKNAIPASLFEWADFFENADRHVKEDCINDYRISTVFLGLNHNYDPFDNKPHIFETMVFKGDIGSDIYCDRYATRQEAEDGHARAVQWVNSGCKDK